MNIVNPRSRIMDLVTQTLERLDFEAEAIKKDDVKFYEYLISTTILHDCASRLFEEARTGWGCKKKDHTIPVCKDTREDQRQKIFQSRANTRKIAAMMFKSPEEDRALLEECLWFPCFLDSGAFTTAIPQKVLKKWRDRWVSLEENKLDEPMQIDQAVLVALASQNLLLT